MKALLPPDTRAVFFDAVGTLLFPKPSAPTVYADVARRAGLELPVDDVRTRFLAAYRAQEKLDRAAGWVTSEEREVERWRTIVSETLRGVPDPDACFHELFEHFAKPTAWEVDPHIGFVLGKLLERGFVVGMGSNYDARLLSVLAGFPELAPLRERVVVSAAVGFRKPAGEFFRGVIASVGCEADQIVFVGDDLENDYHGAEAAGLHAVLLDPRGKYMSVKRAVGGLSQLLG
jgi:putative hydrolase of the HAD superfamily